MAAMTARSQEQPRCAVLTLRKVKDIGNPVDFAVTKASGQVQGVLGFSAAALVGRTVRAVFPTPRVDPILEEFDAILVSGEVVAREIPTMLGILPATWISYRATRQSASELEVEVCDLTEAKLVDVRHAASASIHDLLFERSPLGVVVHGPDGRIVDANGAFARFTGRERVALLGTTIRDVVDFPPDLGDGSYRAHVRGTGGAVHAIDVTTAELPHGYRQLHTRDVTALEESEERFRAAFDDAGAGMAIVTRDGRNLRVNRALTTMLGYTEEELLGITWKDVVHPDDLDASLLNWEKFDRRDAVSLRSEKRYFHKDGHPIWVQVILSMVRDHAGNPLYYLAQVEDISERRRLAEALRDSEQRFRSAFEQSAVGMALLSPTAETLRINQALADLLGHDYETARTLQWVDILHPDDRADAGSSLRRVATGEQPSSSAERRYIRRDGSIVWVQVTVSSVLAVSGKPQYLLAQIEDISERHRLASERKAMEERLELVLQATRDGMWDWDCDTGSSYFGPQWFGMLGYPAEERTGAPEVFTELLHPDDAAAVWAANEAHRKGEDGGTYDQTFRMRRIDGSWAWIRSRGRVVARAADGRAIRMVGTHTDVTAQRVLEEQFRQAQKMEAIGKLAGGVAHDFNNLIAAISATSELLLGDLDQDDTRRDDVQNIALACDRAKTLTRQLLSFSRQEVERLQIITIDDVVDAIRPLLHRLMGPDQRLQIERGARGIHVRLDPAQLELALINLVANARDAMPGGGEVTVRTQVITVNGNPLPGGPAPGTYVRLDVADTGVGIDPDVKPLLFEPFFTTKPHGKGTGLGLPTVHGFVERLGGTVTVHSTLGEGATFSLYLPVTAVPQASAPDVAAPRPAGDRRRRRILVVDDDTVVRVTTRRLLERRGFVVVEACDADTAQAVLDTDPAIDIVLSDHAMPGRTGRQLLGIVEQRYPEMHRVLMSGFAADGAVREVLQDLQVPFVAKPFTIDELLGAIGE